MIDIQNAEDNECFIWCYARYLNPADQNPRRISKADEAFAKRLDFKDIKFPVEIRDIHKINKKSSICISVFGYENIEKYLIYVSKKCCEEKHVELLLMGEGEKNTMCLPIISIESWMIILIIDSRRRKKTLCSCQ